jgi:hypothetical protein
MHYPERLRRRVKRACLNEALYLVQNKKTTQIALRRSNYYRLTASCEGSIFLAASSQNPQLAGYHYSFRSAQTWRFRLTPRLKVPNLFIGGCSPLM